MYGRKSKFHPEFIILLDGLTEKRNGHIGAARANYFLKEGFEGEAQLQGDKVGRKICLKR